MQLWKDEQSCARQGVCVGLPSPTPLSTKRLRTPVTLTSSGVQQTAYRADALLLTFKENMHMAKSSILPKETQHKLPHPHSPLMSCGSF